MQAKGEAAKRARAAELRATNEALRAAIESTPEFRETALMRVRVQAGLVLTKIDKELEKAVLDHRALGALAATLATFESIEQKLSMRAGPGNLKPTAERKPRPGGYSPPPRPIDDDGPAG